MSAESAAVVGVMGNLNGFGHFCGQASGLYWASKTLSPSLPVNIVMAILLIVLQVPLVFVVAMAVH